MVEISGSVWAWALAFLSLMLSFVFSGSETGYLTSNKPLLKIKSKNRRFLGKFAHYYLENPEVFLVTILVGNNLVAVTFTTIATFLLEPYLSPQLSFTVITATILFFGEIIPKTIFRSLADSLFIYMTPLIRTAQKILAPIIYITNASSKLFLKVFDVSGENYRKYISRKEIEELMMGAVDILDEKEEQKDILANLLKLERLVAKNAMVSRMDIFAMPINSDFNELIDAFQKNGYSRIIVYEEELDKIRGYLHYRSLIESDGSNWTEFIRPILFFPETKKLDEILLEFRKKNEKIAIVVDEFGGVEGLLTIEDVLEEFLGNILDEYDKEERQIKKIGEGIYLVDAHTDIDEVNEALGVNLPLSKNYNSVSGFILQRLGKIPKIGSEIIPEKGWKIVVIETSKTGVKSVRFQKEKQNSGKS